MPKYDFDSQVEIAEMELKQSSTLRVTLIPTSSGETAVGLREWIQGGPGDYSGPTKKGIIVPFAVLESLIVALKSAQKTLAEDGASV